MIKYNIDYFGTRITNFSFFLILILPFSLISGPAIPDISISLTGLFFLCFLSYGKKFSEIYNILLKWGEQNPDFEFINYKKKYSRIRSVKR